MTLRAALLAIALTSTLTGLTPISAFASDAKLTAAVADRGRASENTARDHARHPAASLEFWGLKPGQTVIEVAPGGGYWSEILAPYAKQTGGRYIAATGKADQKLPDKFADKAKYGDIHYTVFSNSSGPMGPANSADLVLTARNIHDWLWTPGMAEKSMRDFYAVLKPGGILALAEKAGFKLDGKSEINANPKDTKDHPFGVWTLPPVRRSAEKGEDPKFDHSKYDAIGESDRMTLRFRKPA
jgi:predicted methyltransferase